MDARRIVVHTKHMLQRCALVGCRDVDAVSFQLLL